MPTGSFQCSCPTWSFEQFVDAYVAEGLCYWPSRVGPFQHPCTHTPLPGSQTSPAYVVVLGRKEFPAPTLHSCRGSGALGSQGLMAFASILPLEAVGLCLVTLAGRRVSYSFSPGANRFCFYSDCGSKRVCCPSPTNFPSKEGFASFERRVQEAAGFHACPLAAPSHLCHQGDSGLLPTPVGTAWREAHAKLLESECRLLLCLGSWVSWTETLIHTQPLGTC